MFWIRQYKWPKSWSSMEDPVVLVERNLYGHLLAGKGLFLSVYVDDIKLAGKTHNIDPMWKVLNEEVDLGEPTSFSDHVCLGCSQRQCELSKDVVNNYRTMFKSRICGKILVFLHGRMTWWVMQRSVWNDIVSWRTRRLSNSTKYLFHYR